MTDEHKRQSHPVRKKATAEQASSMSREERLAAALRANLRRRKGRRDGQDTSEGSPQSALQRAEEEK